MEAVLEEMWRMMEPSYKETYFRLFRHDTMHGIGAVSFSPLFVAGLQIIIPDHQLGRDRSWPTASQGDPETDRAGILP